MNEQDERNKIRRAAKKRDQERIKRSFKISFREI